MNPKAQNLRASIRGIYDIQKLRIQTGNRIVAQYYVRNGVAPGQRVDTALDKKAADILKKILKEYELITDGIVSLDHKLWGAATPQLISSYAEFCLIAQYKQLRFDEEMQFKALPGLLTPYAIWPWLESVPGIGPALAGILIAEIDITRCTYPSSLWAYAGLDVAQDGAGRSKRPEHLINREYTTRDGKLDTRKSITFNPFLKSKLLAVAASSFIRVGPTKSFYAAIYYDYKNRLENHPKHADKTPKHRHNMALRYMIKRFLVDLYSAWRALEGLPVATEYSEAKLGIVHKTGTN